MILLAVQSLGDLAAGLVVESDGSTVLAVQSPGARWALCGPRDRGRKPDSCHKCGRPHVDLGRIPPETTYRYASPLEVRSGEDHRPKSLDPAAPLDADWQCAACAIAEGQARGLYGRDSETPEGEQ